MANQEQPPACKSCACADSKVLWVRQVTTTIGDRQVRITRRRRECRHCGRVYMTSERHGD